MRVTKHRLSAFSLLELTIVLVIIASVTAGGIAFGVQQIETSRRVQTENKMTEIDAALMAFRAAYGRLPCPADAALANTSANHGVEAANAGTCTGGAPAATFGPVSGTVAGVVPVRTLGLPDEFMLDGWGRRIGYAVPPTLTGSGSFASACLAYSRGPAVTDAAAGSRTAGAAYLLISHGPNGHGGYLPNGTRYSDRATNVDELQNCNCTSAAAAAAYDNIYVQKDGTSDAATPSDRFDDIVRFKERWQMQAAEDSAAPPACNFRVDGEAAGDLAGGPVAFGDINADGYDDLLLGARDADVSGGTDRGAVYVVFGGPGGFPNPLPLSTLDGTNGFRLEGEADSYVTSPVASGDINNDGLDDVIVGAYYRTTGAGVQCGQIYVIFGRASGWGASYVLNDALVDLPTLSGFRLNGVVASGYLGKAVTVGDVNGDGRDDIIAAATEEDPNNRGSVYVVFGQDEATWAATSYDMTVGGALIDGTNGFRLRGVVDNGYIGGHNSGSDYLDSGIAAGDINGDNRDDVVIGAPYVDGGAGANSGAVYVVFGKSAGWASSLNLTVGVAPIDGTEGFRLNGPAASDYAGMGVAVGDISGNSYAEIVIGAPRVLDNDYDGAAFVVFGKLGAWASSTTLNGVFLDGANGFRIDGRQDSNEGLGLGTLVTDFNRDNIGDLILGASGPHAGAAATASGVYVIFGKSTAWNAGYRTDGTLIDGVSGYYVAAADVEDEVTYLASGDFNGDNYPDLALGAWLTDYTAADAGSTYLLFNQAGDWSNPFPLSNVDP